MIQSRTPSISYLVALVLLGTSIALVGCSTSTPQSAEMDAETAAALGMGEQQVLGPTSGVVPDAPEIKKKKGDEYKASTEEQEQFMKDQAAAMQKQQQELDDLRRQRYHDGYLRQRYDVDEDGTID